MNSKVAKRIRKMLKSMKVNFKQCEYVQTNAHMAVDTNYLGEKSMVQVSTLTLTPSCGRGLYNGLKVAQKRLSQ